MKDGSSSREKPGHQVVDKGPVALARGEAGSDHLDAFSVRVERRPGVIRHMLNDEETVVIHIDPRHTQTPEGTTTRMGFPVLLVSGWVADPEVFARKVAALLQEGQP